MDSNKTTCIRYRNSGPTIQRLANVLGGLLGIQAIIAGVVFYVLTAYFLKDLKLLWAVIGVVMAGSGIFLAVFLAKCITGFAEIVDSCCNSEAYLEALTRNSEIPIVDRT